MIAFEAEKKRKQDVQQQQADLGLDNIVERTSQGTTVPIGSAKPERTALLGAAITMVNKTGTITPTLRNKLIDNGVAPADLQSFLSEQTKPDAATQKTELANQVAMAIAAQTIARKDAAAQRQAYSDARVGDTQFGPGGHPVSGSMVYHKDVDKGGDIWVTLKHTPTATELTQLNKAAEAADRWGQTLKLNGETYVPSQAKAVGGGSTSAVDSEGGESADNMRDMAAASGNDSRSPLQIAGDNLISNVAKGQLMASQFKADAAADAAADAQTQQKSALDEVARVSNRDLRIAHLTTQMAKLKDDDTPGPPVAKLLGAEDAKYEKQISMNEGTEWNKDTIALMQKAVDESDGKFTMQDLIATANANTKENDLALSNRINPDSKLLFNRVVLPSDVRNALGDIRAWDPGDIKGKMASEAEAKTKSTADEHAALLKSTAAELNSLTTDRDKETDRQQAKINRDEQADDDQSAIAEVAKEMNHKQEGYQKLKDNYISNRQEDATNRVDQTNEDADATDAVSRGRFANATEIDRGGKLGNDMTGISADPIQWAEFTNTGRSKAEGEGMPKPPQMKGNTAGVDGTQAGNFGTSTAVPSGAPMTGSIDPVDGTQWPTIAKVNNQVEVAPSITDLEHLNTSVDPNSSSSWRAEGLANVYNPDAEAQQAANEEDSGDDGRGLEDEDEDKEKTTPITGVGKPFWEYEDAKYSNR